MIKRKLQRGIAMLLSAAMLVTGVNIPSITAKAATNTSTVFEDDMENESTTEKGWTVAWSNEASAGTEERIGNEWAQKNTTKWWHFAFSTKGVSQTVTLTNTVSNAKAGTYKLSLDADGNDSAAKLTPVGTASIATSESNKQEKAITFGAWDEFETTTTDALVLTEDGNITITITVTIDSTSATKEGWFDLDNIQLTKEVSDEEAKTAAVEALNTLISACEALNQADYQAESWTALQSALQSAKAVQTAASSKTIEEITAATTALQEAKDSLVDAGFNANAGVIVEKVEGITDDFIRGVDISSYASLIESGVKFKDWEGNDLANDTAFFTLLKDAGVNYVRIRIWNHPYADDEKTQGYGAGNSDLDKAVKLGKWATEAGLKVLIDFHYSDFWADPGKQRAPKAWEGKTVDEKVPLVKEFTTNSLNTLLDAGVDVQMVQVGNETNNGICGVSNSDWTGMCKIFQAGCEAVKSVADAKSKTIRRAIHFANPEKTSTMTGFAKTLNDNNVDYDIFASSYYPYWHGTLDNLTKVLKTVATTYNKEVMVAETAWARTLKDGDGQPNIVGVGKLDTDQAYPSTVQGQASEVRDVIAAVKAVGEKGIGAMYWEPAWIPVQIYDPSAANAAEVLAQNKTIWKEKGSGWATEYSADYDPNVAANGWGGSEVDNQAMFDFDGTPLPSLNVFKYVQTGASTPEALDYIQAVTVKADSAEEADIKKALPEKVTGVYNTGKNAEVSVTWNEADIKAITSFGTYRVSGTVTEAGKTFEAVCTVQILPENLLLNGGFEDGGANWTVDGTGKKSNWTDDAITGKGSMPFYSGNSFNFTATQSIVAESAGTYGALLYTHGEKGTVSIQLENVTKDTKSDANAEKASVSLAGYGKYLTPEAKLDAEKGDTLKIIITVDGLAGCWGAVDDVYVYLDKAADTPAPTTYTITYHLNEGTNAKENPTEYDGTKAITLAAPTREGYTFAGWYTDSEFKNKITEIAVGTTGNLTLYANWTKNGEEPTPNKYTITYHLNEGTNAKENPTEYDGTKAITLAAPTREGYTFAGWYTDSEFKNKITEIAVGTTGNLTLYANWTKNGEEPTPTKYKITYNLNGGINATSNPTEYDGTKKVVLANATREGYTFAGWYTDSEFKNKITEIAVGTTGNLTLYANWTKNGEEPTPTKYKITYNLNGGINATSNPTEYDGTKKVVLANATRKGYTFAGWYTDKDFKKKITEIAVGTTGNITLYAKWNAISTSKPIKVSKITLNITSKKIVRNKQFTLKATVTPKNATNKNIQWESSNKKVATVTQTGVVKTVRPGTATIKAVAKDGSDVKATCKVTVPYKITYKLNKGTNDKKNPTSYYNQKITLKKATRKGYTFGGWYSDKKFKKKVTTIAKSSKKDITLYAKWNKVTVKKASIKKVTNVSGKKMKVTINKVSGAKGYRIMYSTDKKFKKGKNTITKIVKGTNTTISKLKKGKTYYVKACAYKLDSKNNKVFGPYSKVKTIKIKK